MKYLKHLFTALLLLCSLTATAHNFKIDGIYYNITNDTNKTVEVTFRGNYYNAYSNEYTGSVVIPENVTYNGTTYSVTGIGEYAFVGCSVTSITIPNSVTSIGRYAFAYSDGLKEVHISDIAAWCSIGFGSADANPLYYAQNLYLNDELVTALVIPNSVTSIGNYAFVRCSGLTGELVIPNSVTSIGIGAFSGCSGLTGELVIPNSVTSIGNSAFMYCQGLTSVVIGNSVTSIGSYAFEDCTGLKTVINFSNLTFSKGTSNNGYIAYYATKVINAPNAVIDGDFIWCNLNGANTLACYLGEVAELTLSADYNGENYVIGNDAFNGCTGLTSIVIPNSVTSIGNYAFGDCTGLTSITIPNSVTSIGDYAFYSCSGLTSVTIPNSVTSIGYSAFRECTGLTSIIIPNSVTSIGDDAFYECDGLVSIEIPGSVTSIGDRVFLQCDGLTSVVIGNGVTSIGNQAFAYCSGLTSIEIPNSVTSIGINAFRGCTGLTSITIPNSVTSIGNFAFYDCTGLKEVHISDLAAWCGIDFGSADANPLYYAKNLYLNNELVTALVIPNSVTSIEWYAFEGCTGLTSIVIPNSVTSIGSRAFYGCTGLKTVINFSNLTFSKGSSSNGYVVYYADKVYNAPNGFIDGDFIWCNLNGANTLACYLGEVAKLTLPADYNGENYVIGNDAFSGCTGLTSIVIPSSVTSIGSDAFEGCEGLTNIEIPNSVTNIGSYAFYGCNNIEKLYIGSSVESIGSKAFAGCEKITEIKVALEKPIRGSADIFADAVYDNATLYIPNGTKSLYEKREPWNIFFDIVEMDFTGIDEVFDEVKAEGGNVKAIYDLQGRVVENPTSGIYIIDGKKVLIK